MSTLNITCCQMQEHFKAIKTADKYFNKNFSDYNCHITKSVRENVGHVGRPKGGLTQQAKFKKEPYPCKTGEFKHRFCI